MEPSLISTSSRSSSSTSRKSGQFSEKRHPHPHHRHHKHHRALKQSKLSFVGLNTNHRDSMALTRARGTRNASEEHNISAQLSASKNASLITATTTNRSSSSSSSHSTSPSALLTLTSITLLAASITLLVISSIDCVAATHEVSSNSGKVDAATSSQNGAAAAADSTRAALEAELSELLQQDDASSPAAQQDSSSKLLSEAIISRLMLGNMSELGGGSGGTSISSSDLDGGAPAPELSRESDELTLAAGAAEPDASRIRKLLADLRSYEMGETLSGGGGQFSQYPVLPAGQAATIKRASAKVGNYLRQQQQQQHTGQRAVSSYGRVNSFDFGLGKRPDASLGASNILRFGDSASGHMAAVSGASGLGKRPSAHRYDFGLGKRVASPAYPRYDFGLGKRAPSRVRYDFGLGK